MILVVMRHARAAAADPGTTDHERPLEVRGRLEAREVGGSLAAWGVLPDQVLCSDARRTRETWERMEGAFGHPEFTPRIRVDYLHALYIDGISAAPAALGHIDAGTALIVGHNPDWEHLVLILCGSRVAMAPATAAILDIDAPDWARAVEAHGRWRLVDVLRPL